MHGARSGPAAFTLFSSINSDRTVMISDPNVGMHDGDIAPDSIPADILTKAITEPSILDQVGLDITSDLGILTGSYPCLNVRSNSI